MIFSSYLRYVSERFDSWEIDIYPFAILQRYWKNRFSATQRYH